jgi:hypothetical protein
VDLRRPGVVGGGSRGHATPFFRHVPRGARISLPYHDMIR